MKTLDELLQAVPGMRRLRSINADLLRILLDRKKGECTWCGEATGKGRRTWCSDQCVKSFSLRCDAGKARSYVATRDRGICAACGRDTLKAEADAAQQGIKAWPSWRSGESQQDHQARRDAALLRLRVEFGYARGQYREVDHDPPVVEYGGLCPVEQLRLLCGACHADETKRLAGRRAAKTTQQGVT